MYSKITKIVAVNCLLGFNVCSNFFLYTEEQIKGKPEYIVPAVVVAVITFILLMLILVKLKLYNRKPQNQHQIMMREHHDPADGKYTLIIVVIPYSINI